MENKKEKLEKLIIRNTELKPSIFKSFNTMIELKMYKEKNKNVFDEYFDNQEEIQTLQLKLMTPKERAEYEENMRLLKLKAEGKPLI
ncbi:MAG TPA: hypothetical protein VF677_00415 [Flavobacterium sp.]|jgi:Fe-S-cluster containining protein